MGFADTYFNKQKGFKPFFTDPPSKYLRYIVVIPAFREPDLKDTLDSLFKSTHPDGHVEVIIVLNMPENADQVIVSSTLKTALEIRSWIRKHDNGDFRFLLIGELRMPVKDAGVGMARKAGMDQALYRFNLLDNPSGFIISLDADSLCDSNYFTSVEETLRKHPLTKGFNLYFEHPISGTRFPVSVYRGIAAYELHLRYLNLFIRYTGFPHAYHTVGSCFGVRADAYAREGGMNKRKAGEDFYFIHKIIQLGDFREINSTCVIPSPRESDRVPFGTGAAISKLMTSGDSEMLTYAPACFYSLRAFFYLSGTLYGMTPNEVYSVVTSMDEPLKSFLFDIQAIDSIQEINSNAGSSKTFINRFFRWFDAFRIVKYLNYASRVLYRQVPVKQAVIEFLHTTGSPGHTDTRDDVELLNILRKMERYRV